MTDLYDELPIVKRGGAVDLYDELPIVKRQVGAWEAGKRGATQMFRSGQQRLGNMAMLPIIGAESVANLFRDEPDFAMSDWGMANLVDPHARAAQQAAIKPNEEMGLGAQASNILGTIAGMFLGSPESLTPAGAAPRLMQHAVTPLQKGGNILAQEFARGQPMAQTNMLGRSNQLQAQGVPADVANAATLHSYGTTDAAAFAVPLSIAGKTLARGATGAPAMVATEVPSIMNENEVLRSMGQGQHAQDLLDPGQLATSGGVGAAMAMLLGQRPVRPVQTPENLQAYRDSFADREAQEAAAAAAPYTPEVGQAYRDAGEDPDSVARAFERARLFGTPDPNPDITTRTVKGDLTPEQVQTIKDYTGATDAEIATMTVSGQRKLLMRAMQAQERDAGRSTLSTSFGEEPLSSPASRPDVPGDRMAMPGELDESGRRITGDAREAGIGADVNPAVAKRAAEKKAKMVEELDAMRQQLDALDNNEERRELKRKADMGLGMTDNERKAHSDFTEQRDKLAQGVFDLEGRIYDIEAKSELGSRTSTGTSDRPFRTGDVAPDSFEAAARSEAKDRATAKADADLRAQLDALEAEWRERQRMRRQEQQQQQAGQRFQDSDPAQARYTGKAGTTREAPLEGGKFKADEFGFVMSDNGSPMQFKHQRDAGWWILKRGNKGNTGQVFEIANHPSGKGYTVRVTIDNGGGNAGRAGDGGGTGGGGAGGGNLVPRGGGNRGTGAAGGGARGVAGTAASPVAPIAVADARGQGAALDTPEVVAEVKRMAENTGLIERGGILIRETEDFNSPDYKNVVGRTKAIPRESWWLERPSTERVGKRGKVTRRFKHDENDVKTAVQAWTEGRKLTAKQQEIVDFMREVARADLEARAEDAARVREAERAGEDEARVEREAIQARDEAVDAVDDLDLGRRVSIEDFEAWLGGNDEPRRSEGNSEQVAAREAPEGGRDGGQEAQRADGADGEAPEPVLRSYDPDELRTRDEQRAAAERAEQQPVSDPDEFVLTGSNRPADEAEARGQKSLLDEPEAPSAPTRAFINRIEVEATVYDEGSGRFVREKVNARQALDAVDSDISILKRMLDCLGG